MLALCLMLLVTYYAFNYAGIIGLDLIARRPQLSTDAGEQADNDNLEPKLDELVGSEHLQSSRESARCMHAFV